MRHPIRSWLVTTAALCLFAGSAAAGPTADVGDSGLRSDILILSAAGLIDNITMQWPLPWSSILSRLQGADLDDQPDYVREAADRVYARGYAALTPHAMRLSATVDAASEPALVRGFDAMGRDTLQGQIVGDKVGQTTALTLAIGTRTTSSDDGQKLVLDGSYFAKKIGPAQIYAGYVPHWWGPGWISALSLSNNARPMAQIGISRAHTDPFETSWLSWLGPWQMEAFVGLLDGKRVDDDTAYAAFRFAFNPLPHLEIGLARTTQLCGDGHPCSPIKDYLNISNDEKHTNNTNDQGNIDIRYSGAFSSFAYETYVQFMNEDTNPLQHSDTSHLYGASVWTPFTEGTGRLTVEYTDSVATYDLWGSGTMPGLAYNNGTYYDGMRYRGRSLGFSLDSDSRLLSVQANYSRNAGDDYTLTFHHAEISSGTLTTSTYLYNTVTTAPVIVNILEGRVRWPLNIGGWKVHLDIAGRVQDDRPRPDRGWLASVETALTVNL